jgi:tetratricopeptide (TPR) repeat protein
LHDEAVQACPPSLGYRLKKFARRNKSGVATAGLALFFIVLLGGVVGWGMRDRTAREQEIALDRSKKLALTEEGIRQALDRGTTSRAELHAILKKPGGVQELLNQPARWELFLKTAQGELAQARRLADRADGSLGAACAQGMDQLELQLTSDQADYDLALRLERISLYTLPREIVGFNRPNTIAEYEAALAPFGVLGDDPAAVAGRLAASPIREQLVAALDQCALTIHVSHKDLAERLLTLARQTAPDPGWGDRVRQLAVWGDRQALERLATEAPTAGLSPRLACIVGEGLRQKGSDLSLICLRRAQAQYPADFWLNFNLAHALSRAGNPAEAIGFYRAALAIRPGSSVVYNNLGADFTDQKRFADAIEAYGKAIDLDPKNAGLPYANLGRALYQQGKVAEAIEAFNKAIEIDSRLVIGHGSV